METAFDAATEPDGPPLPLRLVFVLKLHRACDPAAHRLCGRAEHVASGQRANFDNLAELQDWIERQLCAHAAT